MKIKPEKLKEFEESLKTCIYENEIKNITHSLLEGFKKSSLFGEEREKIVQEVKTAIEIFQKEIDDCEETEIQSLAEQKTIALVEAIRNEEKEWYPPMEIQNVEITPEDREVLKKYGIKPIPEHLQDKVMMHGSTVTEMLTYIKQKEDGSEYTLQVSDIDLKTTGLTNEERNYLVDYYHPYSIDISPIKDLNIVSKFQQDSLVMKQVGLVGNNLSYSIQARKDIQTGSTTLVRSGTDIYGVESYFKLGNHIISSPALFNGGIHPLIRGKIESIDIPAHNIIARNLRTLGFASESGTMLRRYYYNDFKENKYPNKRQLVYNLASIMKEFGLIEKETDIFQQIKKDVIDVKGEQFFQLREKGNKTKYKLEKYMKAELNKILKENGYDKYEERLKEYELSDTRMIKLTFEEKVIPNEFESKLI